MIHINSYKLTPAITATWGDITGNVSNQSDLVEYISTHGGGGNAAWGSISGNISDQTDLMSTLGSYVTESWVSSQQFVTESWVSEQGYLTSSALTGYATESWVSSQGYVNNSQVVSIFNDCNPLVYDMSNPLTYQERYSALKYVMPSEEHMTNPLVLGYWVEGQPNSTISEYTTVEVEGPDFVQKVYVVSLDPRTGQATSVEETGNWHPCWLDPGSYPLMKTYPIGEGTGSPTDRGVVWAPDNGEYGILIGANPTGVDGEFEGLRIDPEGVIGKYVVTGEEDERTGEMTYTDEMYPFATESWVTEQITNSIGSAMSITNQILS